MVNEKYLSDRFIYFERARRYFCRLCHCATTLVMRVACVCRRLDVSPNTLKSGQSEFALIAHTVH